MRAWGIVICLCLFAAGVPEVQAQPVDEQTKQATKRAWDKAQAAMKSGDWGIAQREFGIAYDLTKDPVFFYWIAYSHDKGGNCTAAAIYYKRFLKEGKPSEADRTRANETIARCEGTGTPAGTGTGTGTGPTGAGTGDTGTGDSGTGTGARPPVGDDDDDDGGAVAPATDEEPTGATGLGGPPPAVDTKPTWKWTAAWVSVGATVAFATAGAVLGLSAKSRQEDIENLIAYRTPSEGGGEPLRFEGDIPQRYQDLIDEGEKLDRLSKISFAVAGGAAAAAVLFFVLDATSSRPAEPASASRMPRFAPVASSDGLGLSLRWEL